MKCPKSAVLPVLFFPGDLTLPSHAHKYRLSLDDCSSLHSVTTIEDTEGIISGLAGTNISSGIRYDCRWRIVVPQHRYLVMAASVLGPQGPCSSNLLLAFDLDYSFQTFTFIMDCVGNFTKSPVFFPRSNTVTVRCISQKYYHQDLPTALPVFEILFKSTTQKLWSQMTTEFTSQETGFVTSPGFDVTRPYGPFLDAWCNITIPEQHVMMVSFPHFALRPNTDRMLVFGFYSFAKLSAVTLSGLVQNQHTFSHTEYISPRLYQSAMLTVHFKSERYWITKQRSGMNMSFSFHTLLAAPGLLTSGFFNCSVSHYASFQQHLHCNLKQECEGREDEGAHCPFSSPSCKGWVEAGGKCYIPVDSDHAVSWQTAQSQCKNSGADLAMMKTPSQWEAFWKISRVSRNWQCAYVGLQLNSRSVHSLYRKTWTWVDGSPAFDVNVTASSSYQSGVLHSTLNVVVEGLRLLSVSSDRQEHKCLRFVCQLVYNYTEKDAGYSSVSRLRVNSSEIRTKELGLGHCQDGHLVFNFLSCCSQGQCGTDVVRSYRSISVKGSKWSLKSEGMKNGAVSTIALFICENKRTTVPYTLVCDFTKDCSDQSDESFCTHQSCEEKSKQFQCTNRQCVSFSDKCDYKVDCIDGSDEDNCLSVSMRLLSGYSFVFLCKKAAPFILTYTRSGAYEQRRISSSEPCPESHFRCPNSKNCLPVYLRCNGVNDCCQREDESSCEHYTCPGFYKCTKSHVCMHVKHVCDGFAQCPMKDDEVFCGLPCPRSCYCQGLEVVCRRPFKANTLPHIRYLDASFSGMMLSDLTLNTYLVYLQLASCRIEHIHSITLPNLQVLDLSSNSIGSVNMDVFLSLKQLRVLRLMNNPLTVMKGGDSGEHSLYLSHVDLSHTLLSVFSSEPLQRFLALKSINISFCRVTAVVGKGFQPTPTLQQIDMRRNPIQTYPQNVFKVLVQLRMVFTSNYKLCCPGMLPGGSVEDLCFSPQNELSSCKDLLRSDLYRVFLWLMCMASVVGNLGGLCFRHLTLKTHSASGFSVFVSSLSLADCFMGIYLACVGVADQVYRGSYYLYENTWVSSVWCSVTGVMSLLSSEVSTIIISCITLDRFIALRFPFSTLRFSRQSALVACVLSWLVGAVLSLVPLLVPHWGFYSQTGICIPLPVTRREFSGQAYSFGVMIVFNFVLFLAVASGQGFIYHSVRVNSMSGNTSQKVNDVTIARRLLNVVLSDFLCWFPIGFLGLLASGGIPIPGEVNVAMAIFVLPLNSALNPFLYTFNILLERRRKKKERQILRYLETMTESSSATNIQEANASLQPSELCSDDGKVSPRQEALLCLRKALDLRVVSADQIKMFLSSNGSGD